LPLGIPLPNTLSDDPLTGFLSQYTDNPKLWLINLRLLMRSFPGGCRWCATKYRIENNGSTVPFLPIDHPTPEDQHGSGCVDAVTYYIVRLIANKNAPACDIDDALQGQNPWGSCLMALITSALSQRSQRPVWSSRSRVRAHSNISCACACVRLVFAQ
jgi:hypothetical protein